MLAGESGHPHRKALGNGARLSAEHQPQRIRASGTLRSFHHCLAFGGCCGWSFGHSRLL